MVAYIKGIGNVSPQKTADSSVFPSEISEHAGLPYLKCIEPAYKKYLDPMASRRMSRSIKMGIYAAKRCLEDAGVEVPDAIITGTGLGCIEDTEKFMISMLDNNETMLNPTPFIQSTHNTISAQISILLKCHGYNFTYVHRGFSFESALLDSLMMLKEEPSDNILLGGMDEITEISQHITYRMGHWRKAVAGEGAAFFLLSNTKGPSDYAKITSVHTFYKPANDEEIRNQIRNFLHQKNLDFSDIDLAVLGINGDGKFDLPYHALMNNALKDACCVKYKNLCGEYHTSSSFALWLAAITMKGQQIPDAVLIDRKIEKPIKNILIYNHYRNINHSLILLQNVEF